MKTNTKSIPPAIVAVLAVFSLFLGCSKEDPLDVDLSKSPIDAPAKTDLDNWIKTTLTDPYNIELVYRFDRNLTYPDRNISPVELERVVPTAEALLHTYLKVYEKVAGPTFIKTYTPKQFVLYGSPAYNSNGSITLGTAEGGRRVVLYEINEIDFDNAAQVRRKMRTIHHEFTHIVNQNIAIPPAFEQVTKADYFSDWTNSANSTSVARSLGFVSRYARSEFKEDFAEMVAHLIVEGQIWFDSYAFAAGEDGRSKLKNKEAQVVEYYKQYYGIDFRELQQAFGRAVWNRYRDPRFSLGAWLQGLDDVGMSIKIDPTGFYSQKYPSSAPFDALYQTLADNLAAWGSNPGRKLESIDFRFRKNNELDLVVQYWNTAGTSRLDANFSYTYTINNDGELTFARVAQRGTTSAYNNAALMDDPNRANPLPFLPLQNFLTSTVFMLEEWADNDVDAVDFMKIGKFYAKGDPANYVYGPIAWIN